MTNAFAFTVGKLNYSVNSDGVSVTVTGHVNGTAATGTLTIPETVTYNGLTYSVTSIGYSAFYNCSGLTGNLVIPNSVTTIGKFAFSFCSGFTGNLVISNSVTTIEDATFQSTGFTGNLVIPNSVTLIDSFAFNNCHGFNGNLVIPNSVTTIEVNAFAFCTGFTGNLVIPNSVTTIGLCAFEDCTGFTGNLTIGNSVTTIGDGAFLYCTGFTGDLVIPNSVTTIGSGAFYGCTGFSSVEYYATDCVDASSSNPPFHNCGGQLIISENVEHIPANMFKWAMFTQISSHAEMPPTVGTNAFLGINHNIPVYVPCGSLSDYQNAGGWNEFPNIYIFGNCFEITAMVTPANSGTVTGAGTYEMGETCTLTATANTGYTFTNWTKNGTVVSTNPSYSFTVTSSCTYVAHFSLRSYIISASASPSAGGSVSGAGNYYYGATCTLTATANIGYTFTNWTKNGTVVSNNASYSFTVTSSGTYVAHFSLNSYTISASASPSAGGSVSGAGNYYYGTTCTLTAITNTGYTFTNWTKNGAVVSTSAIYSFTVTNSGTYVAHFSLNSYTISASASPSNGGAVSGGGTYNYGATCTLTATANTGYNFTNWTKNGTVVSTNASYSFTVTSSGTYVAHFSQNSYTISASASPSNGGAVSGGGTYNYGATCTLTAIANTGFTFTN
ncbi:MAG: leucine-rich repeat protein, partial [Muribaculaceae bacterium]|nr:leucine-rich repeat protein [Muribaculaceae bacterium]